MSVTTDDVDGEEAHELDYRALSEYLTVLEDGDVRARSADSLYTVHSASGSTYLVDAELPACECPDHEYRGHERPCKHVRRVQFATGRRDVPDFVDDDAVDPQLGLHVEDVTDVGADQEGDRSDDDVPAEAATSETVEEEGTDRRPTRSEPADFGGGESTGVQDL